MSILDTISGAQQSVNDVSASVLYLKENKVKILIIIFCAVVLANIVARLIYK